MATRIVDRSTVPETKEGLRTWIHDFVARAHRDPKMPLRLMALHKVERRISDEPFDYVPTLADEVWSIVTIDHPPGWGESERKRAARDMREFWLACEVCAGEGVRLSGEHLLAWRMLSGEDQRFFSRLLPPEDTEQPNVLTRRNGGPWEGLCSCKAPFFVRPNYCRNVRTYRCTMCFSAFDQDNYSEYQAKGTNLESIELWAPKRPMQNELPWLRDRLAKVASTRLGGNEDGSPVVDRPFTVKDINEAVRKLADLCLVDQDGQTVLTSEHLRRADKITNTRTGEVLKDRTTYATYARIPAVVGHAAAEAVEVSIRRYAMREEC